jgi:hypothetical protein
VLHRLQESVEYSLRMTVGEDTSTGTTYHYTILDSSRRVPPNGITHTTHLFIL